MRLNVLQAARGRFIYRAPIITPHHKAVFPSSPVSIETDSLLYTVSLSDLPRDGVVSIASREIEIFRALGTLVPDINTTCEALAMATKPFDSETLQVIKQLQELKPQLDSASPKPRIEFAILVFKFDLYREFISYEIYDEFGLGERDFDTCFEMNDGDVVVHGVMVEALQHDGMRRIISALGAAIWDAWMVTYTKTEEALALGHGSLEDGDLHEHWLAEQKAEHNRLGAAVGAAENQGSNTIDIRRKPLVKGDEFYGFICTEDGGLLCLGENNNRGGVSCVQFTRKRAEKVLAMISVSGVKAMLRPTGSPDKFSVSFDGRFY